MNFKQHPLSIYPNKEVLFVQMFSLMYSMLSIDVNIFYNADKKVLYAPTYVMNYMLSINFLCILIMRYYMLLLIITIYAAHQLTLYANKDV